MPCGRCGRASRSLRRNEEPRAQTARATETSPTITAIQQQPARRSNPCSLQSTVEEVHRAARIRQAMELQAQTVTIITAAVYENPWRRFDDLDHAHPQRYRNFARTSTASARLRPLPRPDREFRAPQLFRVDLRRLTLLPLARRFHWRGQEHPLTARRGIGGHARYPHRNGSRVVGQSTPAVTG